MEHGCHSAIHLPGIASQRRGVADQVEDEDLTLPDRLIHLQRALRAGGPGLNRRALGPLCGSLQLADRVGPAASPLHVSPPPQPVAFKLHRLDLFPPLQ